MNTYRLDRYEGTYAVLIQEDADKNELTVLKDRLIAFAKPGDILAIDFDAIGNFKHVEIISPLDKMEKA